MCQTWNTLHCRQDNVGQASALPTLTLPRRFFAAVLFQLCVAIAVPKHSVAASYCDLVLRAETTIAEVVGTRDQLKSAWSDMADALAQSLPDATANDTHRRLVFALRAGSYPHAITAMRQMREAIPECFGLETASDDFETEDEKTASEPGSEQQTSERGNWRKTLLENEVVITLSSVVAVLAVLGTLFSLFSLSTRRTKWRRAPRYPCSVSATLTTPASTGVGTVVNINEYGIQVKKSDFGVLPSDTVDVRTDHFDAPADVMWANEHYMGMRFQTPIEALDVAKAIQRTRRTSEASGTPQPSIS